MSVLVSMPTAWHYLKPVSVRLCTGADFGLSALLMSFFGPERSARMASRPVAAVLALLFSWCLATQAERAPDSNPRLDPHARDQPQAIYGPTPDDPWNRLFHLLFTRTIEARVPASDVVEFQAGDDRLKLSPRVVRRIESGDRAIDPLYPSWLWMGSADFDQTVTGQWDILREPRYSRLVAALSEVRLTATRRPPVARALMQADLWPAYDMFHALLAASVRNNSAEWVERRRQCETLLPLLAATIRGLALSRADIAQLPDTYAAGVRASGLPDLFGTGSEWLEVRWNPGRHHDRAVSNRRVARVFVQPSRRPADVGAFLNGLRDESAADAPGVDAAALIIQSLLVSRDGVPMLSPLTYDVQLRTRNSAAGTVVQYELSRKRLLSSPHTGGLAIFRQDDPAYLPVAGNDMGFASRPSHGAAPVLVNLRQRCASCHFAGFGRLITFSVTRDHGTAPAPVERLTPLENAHARYVIDRKLASDDFRALMRHWTR